MPKTVDMLLEESRLILKTINRIIVEPEQIDLKAWRSEAMLLRSQGGSCLSSTSLLVAGKHIPMYSIDGRCYGFLFDAEKCTIYDVSSTDSNSNRTTKLACRTARKGMNLLSGHNLGIKTLDSLSAETKAGKDAQINKVLLDAWKDSCAALVVRKINMKTETPAGLKNYYLSLLEIALLRKYLIQAFDYPADFKIYQYNEVKGSLEKFPELDELKCYARQYGINEKQYPALFNLLSDKHRYQPVEIPENLDNYLKHSDIPLDIDKEQLIGKLLEDYQSFDNRTLDKDSILLEPVDRNIGISPDLIEETIKELQNNSRPSFRL